MAAPGLPAENMSYPKLEVNLSAIAENANTVRTYLGAHGISVSGVIKFSDGSIPVVGAYMKGGITELASSRTIHLQEIKDAYPEARTLLLRIPMMSELERAAACADTILMSEKSVLEAYNATVRRLREEGRELPRRNVILMLDIGDLREGVTTAEELAELAVYTEKELTALHLRGIGCNFACLNGVLPDAPHLKKLADAVHVVEKAVGHKLETVSGGSSIDMIRCVGEFTLPEEINHLRIGGFIANPITMCRGRGIILPGMRLDTFRLIAEVVEVKEKNTDMDDNGTPRRNWAGNVIESASRGVRTRALLACGSQDLGDATKLIPLEDGIEVVGCSSDHTALDVTELKRELKPGDTVAFRSPYMPLLYAFSTRHIEIEYLQD